MPDDPKAEVLAVKARLAEALDDDDEDDEDDEDVPAEPVDPKAMLMGIFQVGEERLAWLKKRFGVASDNTIRFPNAQHRNSYEADFYDAANYEYLQKRNPWLIAGEILYLDLDINSETDKYQHIQQKLTEIPEEDWEQFMEDILYVKAGNCLDDDRANELEQEEVSRYVAEDLPSDYKRELMVLPRYRNSFWQFAIRAMPQEQIFSVWARAGYPYEHEGGGHIYIEDKALAKLTTNEDVLPRETRKYTATAWRRTKAEYFAMVQVAFLERVVKYLDDAGKLKLSDMPQEVLLNFFLRCAPDSNYGTNKPHFSGDFVGQGDRWVLRSIAEPSDTGYVYRINPGEEYGAMDAMAEPFAKLVTAYRPPESKAQLKFKLESATNVVRKILEAEPLDPKQFVLQGGSDVIAETPDFRVVLPTNRFAMIREWGQTNQRVASDDDWDRYTDEHRALIITTKADNAKYWYEEDYGINRLKLSGTYGQGDLDEILKKAPGLREALVKFYQREIRRDPANADSYHHFMFWVGGAAPVLRYRKAFDPASVPGFNLRAGLHYAKLGKWKEAAKYLDDPFYCKVEKRGAWIIVGDWTDTASMFSNTRHNNFEKSAETLFGGDAYQWFDGVWDGPFEMSWVEDYITEAHWKEIREKLINRRVYFEDTDETVTLTRQFISQFSNDDLLAWITNWEDDHNPSLEPFYDAIRRAYYRQEESSLESAYYEGYQSALQDAIGYTEVAWIKTPPRPGDKSGKLTDRLAFLIPWDRIFEILNEYEEENEPFDDDLHTLITSYGPKAEPREEYESSFNAETFDECLDNELAEIEVPKQKAAPGQLELGLPEAKQLIEGQLMEGYDYSCLLIKLPAEYAEVLSAFSATNILDPVLYHDPKDDTKGREDEFHITVKWGLTDPQPTDDLRGIIQRTKVFPVKLGEVSLFEQPDYDVVKIDVESPWLRALNSRIRGRVPNVETHPTYNPHVTLAYVKKGTCDKLVGIDPLAQSELTSAFYVPEVYFHGPGEEPDRYKERIGLSYMKESADPKRMLLSLRTEMYAAYIEAAGGAKVWLTRTGHFADDPEPLTSDDIHTLRVMVQVNPDAAKRFGFVLWQDASKHAHLPESAVLQGS